MYKQPDPPATGGQKFKYFMSSHWRGIQVILAPPLASIILFSSFPPKGFQYCAFTLVLMASSWVTECIPLPVTSFLPIIIFPLSGVMDCVTTCKCYVNDTIIVFIGSLMLAASVEQSGLHVRMALLAIKAVGYSHYKLLFAMGCVTSFVSFWIANTAATTMVVPINFALLKLFEDLKLLNIYDKVGDTEMASPITAVYFCSATYSATIGGIGTLIGTGTNLVFKALLEETFPKAPEYITFPKYSMFAVPVVILMQLAMYFSLMLTNMGLLRPHSSAAKRAKISDEGMKAARALVAKTYKELGGFTFWECMVLTLFGFAIALFFSRSPQMFAGWGDQLIDYFGVQKKFIRDSANTFGVILLMLLVPSTCGFFKNCSAKYREDLPKGPIPSVINFVKMDNALPYSFMFLLGAGFALSKAAKPEYSNLNGKIGNLLAELKVLPNALVLLFMMMFTVFLTNFASNVAVANVTVPIGLTLAVNMGTNPLQYTLATGMAASYCFLLPVGTPGNLVVQSAAKVSTGTMIRIGVFPTIFTTLITYVGVLAWGPVIWKEITKTKAELDWLE